MSGSELSSIEMLERLVAFDTVSSKSNLPLIAFVEAYLRRHDIPFVRLPNAAGDKAALVATVGPMVDGGVVLSGHTDVVPVDGQTWSSDPFILRRTEDRLYGRGACDMKGFDAVCLSMLPRLKRMPLKAPVHLLLSYDEETTCLGVLDAIGAMGVSLPRPRAVIVGEPTNLRVADAHKSVVAFFTTVHGHSVHSSKPLAGASAIDGGAALVGELNRIADDMAERGDPTGRFDPPCTTVHVGTIQGGSARNITAKLCRLHWEFRGIPGQDDDEIPNRLRAFGEAVVLPRLRRGGAPASIETEVEVNVPALGPDPGSAAETLGFRLTETNRTITVPYGSEAGNFQRAGLATILCGPGNIDQAHQPDEYIEIREIERCEQFVARLGRELAA
jgi:acetylornithine deacetylase